MKNFLERFKSPVVLTELVLVIAYVLKTLGVYEMPNELISWIQDGITLLFSLFAGVNNPTTRDKF